MPLKSTTVAPNSPEPVIVTSVPLEPPVGVKLLIFTWTANEERLKDSPDPFVMLINPDIASDGTMALIEVGDRIVKLALMPRNFTEVIPTKPLPVIVTDVPVGPSVGVKLSMDGMIPKLLADTAVPRGVVTLMRPVVAPSGTVH